MIGTRIAFGDSGPRVLLSVPNTGWIRKEVMQCLFSICTQSPWCQGHIVVPSLTPLENAQHHLVRDLLTHDYDFWLSCDADNPPRKNVLECVMLDRDILGFPTPVWHWVGNGDRPIYWNAYQWDAENNAYREFPQKHGLQKVDAIGGGCFLIAKRVFEHSDMQRGAFTRTVDEHGCVVYGNDMSFCRRAQHAGFGVYAHFGYPCGHMQDMNLCHIIEAYQDLHHG